MTGRERVRARRFAPWPLFLAAVIPFLSTAAPPPTRSVDAPLPLLTNAQQILDLGLETVRRSPRRARLQGVVTFPIDGTILAYVQDATAGIQISYTNAGLVLHAGQRVEVHGFTSGALLAPMLVDSDVRIVGTAPMPEPRRVDAARLFAGEAFGQWVSLEGVIRDVAGNLDRQFLFISSGGRRFHTVVRPCFDRTLPVEWLDARVELRGVCWTDVDRENKPMGFTLYVPGTNHLTFLRPGFRDPFGELSLPSSPSAELRRQSDDRVKIAGEVLFHAPGVTVFLRTEAGPVEARLLVPLARMNPRGRYLDRSPVPFLSPGTRLELIGAPTETLFAPSLQDADVRVLGHGPAPRPIHVSMAELNSGQRDRELVWIKAARLLTQAPREGAARQETLVLQRGEMVFEAVLADGATNALPAFPRNCYLDLAGLCLMQPGELVPTRSFRLLLRTPADLRVSGQWSVWTSPEAIRFAAVAGALGLAALGWIWLLRRRVADRTSALATANRSLQSEIDERKRAESELARALDLEKELNQLKSRFVSLVSHEFRTPLGIIMSAADILRNYADRLAPERRTEHLQEIHDATKHMAGLMEQVLLLGRAESGRMAAKTLPIDLPAFCRKLVDEQVAVTQGRCPITFLAGQLDGSARGDEGSLRHILNNLLANAVKYSPAGAPVELTVERRQTNAVFTVRDHGIGIPPADSPRLFTPFHRCANVGDLPGTGLGLLIVKRCVDLQGGSISFESREGAGTTFTVNLPLFPDGPA